MVVAPIRGLVRIQFQIRIRIPIPIQFQFSSDSVLASVSQSDSFTLALALHWPDLGPDSDLDSDPQRRRQWGAPCPQGNAHSWTFITKTETLAQWQKINGPALVRVSPALNPSTGPSPEPQDPRSPLQSNPHPSRVSVCECGFYLVACFISTSNKRKMGKKKKQKSEKKTNKMGSEIFDGGKWKQLILFPFSIAQQHCF